jgi:hypothetical protein
MQGNFVPTADSCTNDVHGCNDLLDHLVGAGEQRGRYGEAKCLCSLKINDKLEFGRLLHREIGRLRALKNLVDVRYPGARLAQGWF